MLRSSLCLLFTAVFMSAAFAQQGHTDVQSLQYEFGQNVRVQPTPPDQQPQRPTVTQPCPCEKPVVYAPVPRPVVCAPVVCTPVCTPVVCSPICTACRPCYKPRSYVAVPRRALLRPAYCPPYYGYGYSPNFCGYR